MHVQIHNEAAKSKDQSALPFPEPTDDQTEYQKCKHYIYGNDLIIPLIFRCHAGKNYEVKGCKGCDDTENAGQYAYDLCLFQIILRQKT